MDQFPLQFTAPTVIPATPTTKIVQSVTLSGHGDISRIKVEQTPLELSLKDDDVEVLVHYCGLNFTDNYLRLGIIRNEKFPVIMGSECSGYVIRVGRDVKDFKVGCKVLCLQMQGGLFRQIVHVPRTHCFLVPEDISLFNAVGLGLNFVVAHLCLFEMGHLKPKDRVFMQSIAGGVGTALVQLCRTVREVEVFGTASEMKQDSLLTLGMKRVYSPEENYVDRMLRFFPEGADIVINSNGGSDTEKCCKILKDYGMLINIGSNSTAWYPRSTTWGFVKPSWDTKCFSTSQLINRNYSVAGLNVGAWLEDHPEKVKGILIKVFELHRRGQIEPSVHSVTPFNRVADGIKELCERKNLGKIVLDLGQLVYKLDTTPVRQASEEQTEISQQEKPAELKSTSAVTSIEPTEKEPSQEHVTEAGKKIVEDPEAIIEVSEI